MKKCFSKISQIFVAVGALSLVFAALAQPAAALNQGTSITIQPVVDRPAIKAGETTDGVFKIVNDGETDYTFDVYAKPYTVSGLNYAQDFTKDTSYTQISRWITFPQTTFTLKSGDSVDVRYQIHTPASIPDGSQYAAIFAQTRIPDSTAGQNNVAFSSRVGILIYARGDGKTVAQGKIAQQDLARVERQLNHDSGAVTAQTVHPRSGWLAFWYQAAPAAVSSKITNTGNTDFDVQSYLEVKNWFGGRQIAQTAPATAAILPNTSRQIDSVWCNSDQNAAGQEIYRCNAPAMGLFRVTEHVSFLGKNYTYTRLVLILPWWMVIIVVTVILLIVGGFVYGHARGRRQSRRKHNRKEMSI